MPEPVHLAERPLIGAREVKPVQSHATPSVARRTDVAASRALIAGRPLGAGHIGTTTSHQAVHDALPILDRTNPAMPMSNVPSVERGTDASLLRDATGRAEHDTEHGLLGHVPTALLRAARTTRPDPATAAAVSRATGVRLADAPVRRGAAVDAAARAFGAAAFTHDGVVHLPDRHGPTGTHAARELLAHELTHVAQHVRATLDPAHRPALPPRSRDDLEAEAREVARRVARAETPAAAPRHEPPPRTDPSPVQRQTHTPRVAVTADDVPDDATLDRQARLLYPRVRALLDADLARDRQRAGRHPARR